jgi:hypothetical protein
VLLGVEPFGEALVMWWIFVGRSHEDIVAAREDWAAGRRFGTVADGLAEGARPGRALPRLERLFAVVAQVVSAATSGRPDILVHPDSCFPDRCRPDLPHSR